MTDPTRRNRLDEAASPYLRQHADNPVNWQPWDETALAAARERDVPVFLSIGYSACHWCHVMEEESFEDPDVAVRLNEDFVPIKVDREERPDLDSVYMTVCQLVRGGGGWPLSAWLTPQGKPFYVGTYFPPEARGNQPGFGDLLARIADAWEHDREELEDRAEQWASAAAGELESVPDTPGTPADDLLVDAADRAVRSADRDHGGFGRSPKFPHPQRVSLLLRASTRTGEEAYREVALEALDAMVSGGVYDQLGGGFHRYATDADWTVPHFEKMLYDNAELPRAYLAGYRVTGAERYADAVRETLDFVDRELGHPDGGFFSTLDARSEGEEGAFYVWTPDAVENAVDDPLDADCFRARYGVTEVGNFEGETVLTRAKSAREVADEFDLSVDDARARLARAEDQALAARAERPRPARDEKVLAGWNGLAISAFAEAGFVLDDRYTERAVEALDFAREHLWDADSATLSRRFRDGDVAIDGYLEDYAFLARGALDCYQATGDVDHLSFALDLARALVDAFWDDERGTLYFTREGGEALIARPQELTDQSTPSSAGVATQVLLALDAVAPEEGFGTVAERVVETHAATLDDEPLQHATLVCAAETLSVGILELTLVGDALPEAWRTALAERYLPDALLARRPADDDALGDWLDALELDDVPPVWADRGGAAPTAYVCRRACSPPLTERDDIVEWIEELSP